MQSKIIIENYKEYLPTDFDLTQIMLTTNLENTELYLGTPNKGIAIIIDKRKTIAIQLTELFRGFTVMWNTYQAELKKVEDTRIANIEKVDAKKAKTSRKPKYDKSD